MAARQQPRGTGLGVQHEDFVPKSEWKNQPKAILLTIDLPGFTKEQIKVTYVHTSKMLKVTGERPLAGPRRWSRFNEVFSVPHNCLVDKIYGTFNNNSLTITMPKKTIRKMPDLPEAPKTGDEKVEKLEEKRVLEESIRKAKEEEAEKKKKLHEEREAILRKLQEEAKTKEMAERRKFQEEAKAKEKFPLTAARQQPRGTGLEVQYLDFVPKYGWKDEREATLLIIDLPGFTKEQIKSTYVQTSNRLRVTGERPLAGPRRWSRFNEVFTVPHNCLVNKIHGNFNNNSLTITMPKETVTKMPDLPEASKTMVQKVEKLDEKRLLEESRRKEKEEEVEKKKKLLEEKERILRKLQEEAKAKEKAEERKLQEEAKAKEKFPLTAARQQPRGTGLEVHYVDFVPKYGWKDEREAILVIIDLPGFTKEQIKSTYVQTSNTLRVTGERPLAGPRRWSRFNEVFSVPHNCLVDKIYGTFNNNSLTITMPKKTIIEMPNLWETYKTVAEKVEKVEKLEEKRLLEESKRKKEEEEAEKKKKLLEEKESILKKLQEEAKAKEVEARKLQEEAKEMVESMRLQEEAIAKERAEAKKLQEEANIKEMAEARKLQEAAIAKELAEARKFLEEAIAEEKAEVRKLQEAAIAKEMAEARRLLEKSIEEEKAEARRLQEIAKENEIAEAKKLQEAKAKEMAEERKLQEETIAKERADARKLQEAAKAKEMAEARKLQGAIIAKQRAEARRLQEEANAKEMAEAKRLQEEAKAKEMATAKKLQERAEAKRLQEETRAKEMVEARKLEQATKTKEMAEARRLQEEAIEKEKAEARKVQEEATTKEKLVEEAALENKIQKNESVRKEKILMPAKDRKPSELEKASKTGLYKMRSWCWDQTCIWGSKRGRENQQKKN
ncbi:hypothetical protein IGI04_041961 [Brassica rapa subsp. trilocularis]|uniref:SHSP domain-containing protein n=1 Tax=Brassica rapa subsp. trilocularis TaxID=1813537 RepID=A0ABQ7KV78_BRACM|nr:hypothetical protein IGI04_041961 [Brassica rapa subsp. trilocularis]